MTKSLEDDRFKGVTREAIKRTVWARSTQLTITGYSPLELPLVEDHLIFLTLRQLTQLN